MRSTSGRGCTGRMAAPVHCSAVTDHTAGSATSPGVLPAQPSIQGARRAAPSHHPNTSAPSRGVPGANRPQQPSVGPEFPAGDATSYNAPPLKGWKHSDSERRLAPPTTGEAAEVNIFRLRPLDASFPFYSAHHRACPAHLGYVIFKESS